MSDNPWLGTAKITGDDLPLASALALIAIAEELHRMNERNEPQTMSAESLWPNKGESDE